MSSWMGHADIKTTERYIDVAPSRSEVCIGSTVDHKHKRGQEVIDLLEANGRAGEIRTRDLLTPSQARYQAAPRPERRSE